MNALFLFIIFSYFNLSAAFCSNFQISHLPKMVKNFIKENEKNCHKTQNEKGESGQYNIDCAINRLNFLNHPIEYVIYLSEGAVCSTTASFDQGNSGPHLIVFANLKGKWQKIHDEHVLSYRFISPNFSKKDLPTNLVIQRKGVPGSTVEEVEYEWNSLNNKYETKKVKEDIHNLKGQH